MLGGKNINTREGDISFAISRIVFAATPLRSLGGESRVLDSASRIPGARDISAAVRRAFGFTAVLPVIATMTERMRGLFLFFSYLWPYSRSKESRGTYIIRWDAFGYYQVFLPDGLWPWRYLREAKFHKVIAIMFCIVLTSFWKVHLEKKNKILQVSHFYFFQKQWSRM